MHAKSTKTNTNLLFVVDTYSIDILQLYFPVGCLLLLLFVSMILCNGLYYCIMYVHDQCIFPSHIPDLDKIAYLNGE